jgi:hypothetical protein
MDLTEEIRILRAIIAAVDSDVRYYRKNDSIGPAPLRTVTVQLVRECIEGKLPTISQGSAHAEGSAN